MFEHLFVCFDVCASHASHQGMAVLISIFINTFVVCIYIYIYVYTHKCMYISLSLYIYIYICMFIFTSSLSLTCLCAFLCCYLVWLCNVCCYQHRVFHFLFVMVNPERARCARSASAQVDLLVRKWHAQTMAMAHIGRCGDIRQISLRPVMGSEGLIWLFQQFLRPAGPVGG